MSAFRLLLALPALSLLVACDASNPRSASSDHAAPPAITADAPVPDAEGKVRLSEAEWRARLSPEQFKILRQAGTERAFSGAYWRTEPRKSGTYHCAGCDLPLFASATKFDSGTGWPSFYQALAPDRVIDRVDNSYGMVRTENICARCDGHLGHSFPDGPAPTGLRYCINSLALRFVPER